MTKDTSSTRRIMLALTEANSLQVFWRAAMDDMTSGDAELITVFVHDDRWHRAASLPFTTEVSRASGGSMKFTPQRAEEVAGEAVSRAQRKLRQLALESRIQPAFEILAEHEAARLCEFIRSESDLLIAPSFFKERPFYSELTQLKCRILLVDAKGVSTGPEED